MSFNFEEGQIKISRKTYDPDDITDDGKPRICRFRQTRKGNKGTRKKVDTKDKENSETSVDGDAGSEIVWDREAEEMEDGETILLAKEHKEQNTVLLNMMADLQTETVVLLGDVKIDQKLEAEYTAKNREWEEYKRKHGIKKWKPVRKPAKKVSLQPSPLQPSKQNSSFIKKVSSKPQTKMAKKFKITDYMISANMKGNSLQNFHKKTAKKARVSSS